MKWKSKHMFLRTELFRNIFVTFRMGRDLILVQTRAESCLGLRAPQWQGGPAHPATDLPAVAGAGFVTSYLWCYFMAFQKTRFFPLQLNYEIHCAPINTHNLFQPIVKQSEFSNTPIKCDYLNLSLTHGDKSLHGWIYLVRKRQITCQNSSSKR